jgi:long-subunit fatty acid transport protein
VTTGVESFGNSSNYLAFGTDELPISSLHYLEMPFEIAYRFNDKFQVNLGVKAGYLLKAKYNGSLSNNFSSRAQADKSLENDLARFDFSTSLGIGFYPTKKFGFDLRYNHGWVDYTPDNIWPQNQIDTNKNIQLSMLYFFGKK